MYFFGGTKNPQMPFNFYKSEVRPLELLCEQVIQSRLTSEKDFMFLKETRTNSKVPDFHGFNTRATRDSGKSTKAKDLQICTFDWQNSFRSINSRDSYDRSRETNK